MAEAEAKERRSTTGIDVHGAKPGIYIQFDSQPGYELNLGSLEDRRQGIELVAVTEASTDEAEPRRIQRATVFVPDGKLKHFVARFQKYARETPKKKGERRHEDMVDRIAALRLATLRALWTDAPEAYPNEDETIWWEVWLRRQDGNELERLLEFADQSGITVSERRLGFDERTVVLVRAHPNRLAASLDVLSDIAEVRRAKETAVEFVDMGPAEQADWAAELKQRTQWPPDNAPVVCILDTGVTRGHPLLDPVVRPEDVHAIDPAWGTHDDGGGPGAMGHGTQMAGLAIYGDLAPLLVDSAPLIIRHRLESVKILPPRGANPPELYGTITAEAAARVEVQAPGRHRCFSLAVTATDKRDRGEPTSWSAAVDALAAGRSFDSTTQGLAYLDNAEDAARRLFVVSAGNVTTLEVDHLSRSDTEPVQDPAHAWNALTVGAFTEKATIRDPGRDGWAPVASPGDLSPWSTTSVTFERNKWPLKPDVVFEGGNVACNGTGDVDFPVPDLCLLSTHHKPAEKLLVLSWATSAACAQAARLAAIISAEYPTPWPETIRALIVHSAEWTPAMSAYLRGASGKRKREVLVRRYGFGVPSLPRALRSASDALTLVLQSTIRPFERGKMREIHIHELPWPEDVLASLGATPVRLRVTLSYFIEPNPGRRGWKKRHRYASHGLRFEVRGAAESTDEFRKRLNRKALDEEEEKPAATSDASEWFLGEQARNRGSLHSDIWAGTAADLADRGVIGVYPVTGWWKEQPARDRSDHGARYALVVSIETKEAEVDIWTPVAAEVGIPVEVADEILV
ncbi:MAG TPA: S8 family peptidase [Longimicrobiales bacterium]